MFGQAERRVSCSLGLLPIQVQVQVQRCDSYIGLQARHGNKDGLVVRNNAKADVSPAIFLSSVQPLQTDSLSLSTRCSSQAEHESQYLCRRHECGRGSARTGLPPLCWFAAVNAGAAETLTFRVPAEGCAVELFSNGHLHFRVEKTINKGHKDSLKVQNINVMASPGCSFYQRIRPTDISHVPTSSRHKCLLSGPARGHIIGPYGTLRGGSGLKY